MNKLLLLALLSLPTFPSSLPQRNIFAPTALGKIALEHRKGNFFVVKDKEKFQVGKENLDKQLRSLTKQQVTKLAEMGLLSVNQLSDGSYTVKATGKLKGGGPVTAAALYWITKSLCWGGVGAVASGAALGVGAAIVSTGGTAGPIIATTTQAAFATAVAGTGAGAAGATGAAVLIGGSTVATEVATGLVIGGGATIGTVGLVGGIEAASMSAWAIGMAIPWI